MSIPPHLPPNANLDHLKKQARKLLQAFQAGDPNALIRVKSVLSKFAKRSNSDMQNVPLTLRECQQTIAREYGFTSWQKMSETIQSDKRPKNNGLSDRFKSILELAQEEAFRRNHTHIDSEHLLLSLFRMRPGSGVSLLRQLGLNAKTVQNIKDQIKHGPEPIPKNQILFSPNLKTIFDMASDEADENDSPYVRTCHLILALSKDQNSTSHKLLMANDIKYQAIKDVLRLIQRIPPHR